jgi:hypothetical protein
MLSITGSELTECSLISVKMRVEVGEEAVKLRVAGGL